LHYTVECHVRLDLEPLRPYQRVKQVRHQQQGHDSAYPMFHDDDLQPQGFLR